MKIAPCSTQPPRRPMRRLAPRAYATFCWLTLCAAVADSAADPKSAPAAFAAPEGSIIVELQLQSHPLYVGESVPVLVQVGTQDDLEASLDNPPSLKGDAFALDMLSARPEWTHRMIRGGSYTLFTWHSKLAAIKPGVLSLSIEAPFTVKVPTGKPSEPNFADESTGDQFNNPAFQGLLPSTTERSLVASSTPISIDVHPLPAAGRPPGFSGAVGTFRITSELSRDNAQVGEPLTLRLRVVGSGNFDRVDSAMLSDLAHWKTFRPTTLPATVANEKVFEQTLVAMQPGMQQLPELSFNYFDPETGHYAVARAARLSIRVAPSQLPAFAGAAPGVPPMGALANDHVDRGIKGRSLTPLYLQARFLALPALSFVVFVVVWFRLRRPN